MTPKIAMPARSLNSMNTAVPLGFPKGTSHRAGEGGIALLRGLLNGYSLGCLTAFPAE